MPISLQSDAVLPQGHILVDGQRVASFSTTGGLSATLSQSVLNNQIYQMPGAFNFRNKIINGNFDIWQRGTSLPSGTGGRFIADRWINSSVGSTSTVTREAFAVGQTEVPNEPVYFIRTNVTSVAGVGNSVSLFQRIEGVRTLAGKTATVSFWAKADSSKNISIEFPQNFGTNGSTTVQGIGVQKLLITSTWQKYTFTINVPSIQNKIISSNNTDRISLIFWFDAGSNLNNRTNNLGQQSGTFDIAQVQLEEGSAATPFEQRPFGLELSLCQRYYEKSYDTFVLPGSSVRAFDDGIWLEKGTSTGDNLAGSQIPFKVQKRTTPSMQFFSNDGILNNWRYTRSGVSDTLVAITSHTATEANFRVNVSVGAAWSANRISGHYTASAEL